MLEFFESSYEGPFYNLGAWYESIIVVLCDMFVKGEYVWNPMGHHGASLISDFQVCWCILVTIKVFSLIFDIWQIKDDTKRAVYCALIKLLLNRDLSVRVWSITSLSFAHHLFRSFFQQLFEKVLPHQFSWYFSQLKKLCFCYFSWQPVDLCAYILKMPISRNQILVICFLFVGIHALSWSRKFRSLTQRCMKFYFEFMF